MVRVVIGKVVGDNGKSLEFKWNNETYQLGLKKEGDTEYSWSPSLRGIQGEQGDDGGDGFSPSVTLDGTVITIISKDPVDGKVKTYTHDLKGDKGDRGTDGSTTVNVNYVTTLPTASADNKGQFFFKPSASGITGNNDGFMCIQLADSTYKFEQVGIDPDDYCLKTEIEALIGTAKDYING